MLRRVGTCTTPLLKKHTFPILFSTFRALRAENGTIWYDLYKSVLKFDKPYG